MSEHNIFELSMSPVSKIDVNDRVEQKLQSEGQYYLKRLEDFREKIGDKNLDFTPEDLARQDAVRDALVQHYYDGKEVDSRNLIKIMASPDYDAGKNLDTFEANNRRELILKAERDTEFRDGVDLFVINVTDAKGTVMENRYEARCLKKDDTKV